MLLQNAIQDLLDLYNSYESCQDLLQINFDNKATPMHTEFFFSILSNQPEIRLYLPFSD